MLAVDTNVVVRFLVRDDAAQSARAAALIGREQIWVSRTVLLEIEWVLRRLYGYSPAAVASSLRDLLGLNSVTPEDPAVVEQALDWLDGGMDFADALHLAASAAADQFATFDRKLAGAAKRVGAGCVLLLT